MATQQLRFYRATGNLPARRDAWIAGDLETDPLVAGFWDQMQHLRSTPAIPEWERIASGIERAAEAVVRHEQTIDEAVTTLDVETDAILEKRRWLMSRREPASRTPSGNWRAVSATLGNARSGYNHRVTTTGHRFVTCNTQVIAQFSRKVFVHFEFHAERNGSRLSSCASSAA